MRNTTQQNKLQNFEQFEVEAVAGRKYIEERWISLVKWKGCDNQLWVGAEDLAVCKELVDQWYTAHLVLADHLSKQWREIRMEV